MIKISYQSNDYNTEAWDNKMITNCREQLNLVYRELIKQRLYLLIFQLSGGNYAGQISKFVKF